MLKSSPLSLNQTALSPIQSHKQPNNKLAFILSMSPLAMVTALFVSSSLIKSNEDTF